MAKKKDTISKDMKLASIRQQLSIEEELVRKHTDEVSRLRKKLEKAERAANGDAILDYVNSRNDAASWCEERLCTRFGEQSVAFVRDQIGVKVTLSPSQTRLAYNCVCEILDSETATSPAVAVKAAAARLRYLADVVEDKLEDKR